MYSFTFNTYSKFILWSIYIVYNSKSYFPYNYICFICKRLANGEDISVSNIVAWQYQTHEMTGSF